VTFFHLFRLFRPSDFVDHGPVGGGEDVGFGLFEVYVFMGDPQFFKRVLDYILSFIFILNIMKDKPIRPVGEVIHAFIVFRGGHGFIEAVLGFYGF
jgi:hypothetical protein